MKTKCKLEIEPLTASLLEKALLIENTLPEDERYGRESYEDYVSSANAVSYVGSCEGDPVLTLTISFHSCHIAVQRLVVRPTYRLEGYGRDALSYVMGKIGGATELESVRAIVPHENTDFHLFLKACGWTSFGFMAGDTRYGFEYPPGKRKDFSWSADKKWANSVDNGDNNF